MDKPPDEFERLRRAGDAHYLHKEYSIAVECYKAAVAHGAGDADFCFNFAYSLAATGNDELAATKYRDAIRAGSVGSAHNNLGNCLRRLTRLEEALEAHLQATRHDGENSLFWRNLAQCYRDLTNSEGELQALVSLCNCYKGCTATDWNDLGRAHERRGSLDEALAAFRQAAYQEPSGTYFFNIALMHERRGRVLDAYHACVHSVTIHPGYESSTKMLPRLTAAISSLPSLVNPLRTRRAERNSEKSHLTQADADLFDLLEECQAARLKVVGKPLTHECGPHDYLNPYSLLNLELPTGLPDPLEWFEQPADWGERTGSLTRRRRAIQAGLELDEGCLEWMPGVHLTEEVVHRVLSRLDDDGWHAHHWIIFHFPLLNRFLMFGDLEYFRSTEQVPYPLITDIAGLYPEDYEQEEFLEFLSPYFRRQWTEAIKEALQSEDYAATRGLFVSQTPVTTSDLDEAMEPVRRHFKRRVEAIRAVEAEVEKRKEGKGSVQPHRAAQESLLLNVLPGASGANLRDELAWSYRSLGISLANVCGEFEEADLAIKAAEALSASETVKAKLAEDRKALSGIFQRRQEERKKLEEAREQEKRRIEEQNRQDKQRELSLTRRMVLKSWFREKTLEITPAHFAWDDQRITADKITSIRYGITIRYTNGIKSGTSSILAVSGSGVAVSTDWLGEANFQDAVRSVMGLYSTRVLTNLLTLLEQNRSFQIGDVRFDPRGLTFDTGFFKSTPQTVTWEDASAHIASGNVLVSSRSNTKAKKTLSLPNDWNACLLPTLVEIVKRSNAAHGNKSR